MLKRFSVITLCLIFIWLAATAAQAAVVLEKIRYRSYPDKLRIVLDLNQKVSYQVSSGEGFIGITLPKTSASNTIKNVTELDNEIINYIGCEKLGEDLKLGIFLRFSAPYQVYLLTDPERLVIDCSRDFTTQTLPKLICPGVEYLEIVEGLPEGHTRSHVLRVDPDKVIIKPALGFPSAKTENWWENLGQFLGSLFSEETEEDLPSFSINTVSEICQRYHAIAAINGTYFAGDGRPLGILMIDKEIISLPPYERTALALTIDNKAYIDTFLTATYFSLKDKTIYEITKINEPRGGSDCILYTPRYGSHTRTLPGGFEITVQKEEIANLSLKDSPIPADGFVLSVKGAAIENLAGKCRIGDPLKLELKLVPYSLGTKADILHLVGGGPRLVKKGKNYVSKFGERFKKDIASGRAARTAIGVTKDHKLLLVTVDGKGKGKESVGMTLEELSEFMLYLGAAEAMNLDGGGSSTMVINNEVVNQPVYGKERKVSNALIILPR